MSRTSCAVAGAAPPRRLTRSSVARATNELVIAAVITARKASPINITPAATSCPAAPRSCANYAQPLVKFPAHSSPMGLGYLNGKLYVALYGGLGKGPVVVSMPPSGGPATPFLSGFRSPVIALGTARGNLYAGDQSGVIYRVRP